IRYRQLHGEAIEVPDDAYPAEYVKDIAREISDRDGDKWMRLGLEEQTARFADDGVRWVLREAKRVTAMLGISYDTWFSQSGMMRSGRFDKALAELRALGLVYERDGAIWLEASEAVQDTEGWVLVRSNGEPGYLGKDIAYQLDFDLELAIQQSNENPVYYVQYAHARIASIFRTASERGITEDGADLSLLNDVGELGLVRAVLRFPELVDDIRQHYGVHQLTTYALELAGAFHGFYRDHVVVDQANVARSKARLR